MSLYTKVPQSQVKHYHIKQNPQGFFLSEKHCCATIPELIKYHSFNAGGLACRLKSPPGRCKPPTAGLAHGKWEIDPTELVRAKILYVFKQMTSSAGQSCVISQKFCCKIMHKD